jgi:hypothetical protein
MRRNYIIATAASMVLATGGTAVASTNLAEPSGTITAPAAVQTYEISFNPKVDVDDLAPELLAGSLQVLELRHSGATSGIMQPGTSDLADALRMYVETNVANFGVEPEIASVLVESTTIPALAVEGTQTSIKTVDSSASAANSDESPTSTTDEGEVTAASITKPWALSDGTVRAENINYNGFPRQMKHRYRWDSRSGLDSYDDWAYEHDVKLLDPGAGGIRPFCSNDNFWAARSYGVMMSTNMPEAAGIYFDTDAQDGCDTMDFTWGLYKPGKLAVSTYYTTIIGAVKGLKSSSSFALNGQKLSNDCQFLPDNPNCIGLNGGRKGVDGALLVGSSKGVAPGCFSWVREQPSTKFTC